MQNTGAPRIYTAVLECHPQTPSQAVDSIEARVARTQANDLSLAYTLTGDITRLRLPPVGPWRPGDGLWQHTCFEAFISVKGNEAYYEFNFAPSGEWAVYAFRRYRDITPFHDGGIAPELAVRRTNESLELETNIAISRLPQIQTGSCLRLGLSAVVEEEGGMLSYWAVKHAASKPDFHHPDTFALEVDSLEPQSMNQPGLDKG
jgi:hypothetical protein